MREHQRDYSLKDFDEKDELGEFTQVMAVHTDTRLQSHLGRSGKFH